MFPFAAGDVLPSLGSTLETGIVGVRV